MANVSDVRSTFLNYFKDQGHEVVSSSSLVPHNDPTLMFTNAGMNQFKDIFTGKETRDYSRATTSQKCVRAGGKHNDLENVGHTARHHTFFEMLGNFSFADYFKEEAISYAWELLTKGYGIDQSKLIATVYHTDDEAYDLWKKIAGFSDDRIIRISTNDNFWSMGDTGPCGPCTEVFYDHGDKIWGGPPGSPEEDGDRFIEIWNIVFMQHEKLADGTQIDLPKPCVDTGMGLERITTTLNGSHDNYDIDIMRALIEASADLTHQLADGDHNVSHRVIADHLRSAAFLIADGVLPSNEGRGYVLRRIMRRGMRHAHLLGAKDPLMYRLFPVLLDKMGKAYSELGRAEALITETLKLEEQRFKKTLDKGLHLLEEETDKLGDGETLSGDVAFKLYDTYGFPLDLTQDVLKSQNRDVDLGGFDAAMEKQREQARANWAGSGEVATDKVWFDIREQAGVTEFLGYKTDIADAQVKSLVVDGNPIDTINKGQSGFVIVNQTPFYGESGGQVGDKGTITTESGAVLNVTDVLKKVGDLFVHQVEVKEGTLKIGDTVTLKIDRERRQAIRANHSATHLLHEALRRRLGAHVAQKGSLVDDERLRFDISHQKAMTEEELSDVEAMVNERIRHNDAIETRLMEIDDAIESGALAMFGEKYDDEVRVLSMGGDDIAEEGRNAFSVELCGGTHAERTGDIGVFKIISESAIAAGVRRIEAVTGKAAMDYINHELSLLDQTSATLKVPPSQLPERAESLVAERKQMEKELGELRRKLASNSMGDASSAKDIDGIKFAGQVLDNVPAKELRPLAEDFRKKLGSCVVALVSVSDEGKASIVVGVSNDLVDRFNAVDLVRVGSEALGGQGGGGRPDMAQAGGPDGNAANDALTALEKALASS